MKPIKFKKHFRGYNPGEVAHFDHDLADKLIQTDRAEAIEPARVAEDVTAPQTGREKYIDKPPEKAAVKAK